MRRARLPDWPERLADLVEARRHVPFAWGAHDCALFAADAIAATTGERPFEAWRGRYASEAEADAATEAGGGVEAVVAAELGRWGAAELQPALAQRGDVAMVRVGNTEAVGVVIGEAVAVPGPDRLAFVPLRRAYRAWAV
jgi:hypothetical protein